MNNRHKYKAWLPQLNKMVMPKVIRYVEEGIAVEYEDEGVLCIANGDDVVLLRCTEALAKGGILIFENDLVRYFNRNAIGTPYENYWITAEVVWNYDQLAWCVHTPISNWQLLCNVLGCGDERIEVVGNAKKNPNWFGPLGKE